MRKTKQKKRARITSISVFRLYNLGNYQNVKYDLSAEVPEGVSASKTLIELCNIVAKLRPLVVPSDVRRYEETAKKPVGERSAYEKENLDSWMATFAKHQNEIAERKAAVIRLDELGGSAVYKDAKASWGDEDEW